MRAVLLALACCAILRVSTSLRAFLDWCGDKSPQQPPAPQGPIERQQPPPLDCRGFPLDGGPGPSRHPL